MAFLILVGAVVLIGTAVVAIAWPLLRERREAAEGIVEEEAAADPMAELLEQRNSVYQAIRELRFDYQVGKVSEADYKVFDAQLKSQAVATLKEIDMLKKAEADADLDARVEAEIAGLRRVNGLGPQMPSVAPALAGGTAANFCPRCGSPAQPGDRFCAKCGAALA